MRSGMTVVAVLASFMLAGASAAIAHAQTGGTPTGNDV
jgi:hypothetical protein